MCCRSAADEMQASKSNVVTRATLVLKYLQVLNNISIEKNHTLVLPVPKSLLKRNCSDDTMDEEEAALLEVV